MIRLRICRVITVELKIGRCRKISLWVVNRTKSTDREPFDRQRLG